MPSPDLTAHLQSLAPHATTQLRLHERTVSALKGLRVDDAASRMSTALALESIQAELGHLAMILASRRAQGRLAEADAAQRKAVQQLGSCVGEVARALKGDGPSRAKRLEIAREQACEAETSMKAARGAIAASLGVAAAMTASIPIVGSIIAAILMAVAAIIVLIAHIMAKNLEDQAAQKEAPPDTGVKPQRRPWPP